MITAAEYRRLKPYLYRMEASLCPACSLVVLGQRKCPQCLAENLEPTDLARSGTVIALTMVSKPPMSRRRNRSYAMALIELADGVRILSQVTDIQSRPVAPGDTVHAVFRRLFEPDRDDFICYGIKFRGDKVAAPSHQAAE